MVRGLTATEWRSCDLYRIASFENPTSTLYGTSMMGFMQSGFYPSSSMVPLARGTSASVIGGASHKFLSGDVDAGDGTVDIRYKPRPKQGVLLDADGDGYISHREKVDHAKVAGQNVDPWGDRSSKKTTDGDQLTSLYGARARSNCRAPIAM